MLKKEIAVKIKCVRSAQARLFQVITGCKVGEGAEVDWYQQKYFKRDKDERRSWHLNRWPLEGAVMLTCSEPSLGLVGALY